MPEKTKAKVEHKVAGSLPLKDIAYAVFNLTIMFVLCEFANSEYVVSNSHGSSGSFT